jgi:excisionase family DNA binding protein
MSFTPKEVSIMFGVKPATVYAWMSRRELKANKVGRNRAISQRQLKEFHEQRNNREFIDKTYQNGPNSNAN